MMKNIRLVLVIVLLFFPTLSRADKVYLKSGRSIDGEITSESDEEVKVKIQFGSGFVESTYSKTDIDHIEKPPVKEEEPPTPKLQSKPKPKQTNPTGDDLVIKRMEQLLLSLDGKCQGSAEDIQNTIVNAHLVLLEKHGIKVPILELMESLNMVVPDEVTNLDCTFMMGAVMLEYQKKR